MTLKTRQAIEKIKLTLDQRQPLEVAIGASIDDHGLNTSRNYLVAVREFVKFAGSSPKKWTGAVVAKWREHLQRQRDRRPGRAATTLSPRTVNAKIAALRFASRRAFDLELLGDDGRDFARSVELLQVLLEKKRYAVPIEIGKRIMAECHGVDLRSVRDRALLALGFYHGLRRESLATLQIGDCDLRRKHLTVLIKGRRRHRLPLDPNAEGPLVAWLSAMRRQCNISSGVVFRGVRERLDRDCVISDEGMHPNTIYEIIKRRTKAAGVERFHPHLMRHCFISWAIANNKSIEEIMLVTGHRSPAMIAEYMSEVRGLGEAPTGLVPSLEDEQ